MEYIITIIIHYILYIRYNEYILIAKVLCFIHASGKTFYVLKRGFYAAF